MVKRKPPRDTEWDVADAAWVEPSPALEPVLAEEPPPLEPPLADEPPAAPSEDVVTSAAVVPEPSEPTRDRHDATLELIDEYVSRCMRGDNIGLGEMRDLRRRVAGL